MKRFALIVALLYFFILVALTVPVISASFGADPRDASDALGAWPYWIWLSLMVLSQFALLAIPVKVASRRPVRRGSLLWPLLAGGLMMGGMLVGGIFSIYECVLGPNLSDAVCWTILGLGVLTWALWTILFYRTSRPEVASDLVSRQCRLLIKGSILELLIAVPSHVIARHRDHCCAGFMTFVGLTMGISVMLFSYGPAVFFLFVERWKKLRPKSREVETQ